jgi:hypothetical protein
MSDSPAGKGDKYRNSEIPWQVRDLRYDLAHGHIDEEEYEIELQRLRERGIDVDVRLRPKPITN